MGITTKSRTQDVTDRRVFAAVAQLPFEASTGDGTWVNVFCTLVPVVFDDGMLAGGADQFPNNGLVWWKLRAASKALADPGRLLSVGLEPAPQYVPGDPNKEYYQAISHGVTGLRADEAMEILTIPERAIRQARDLVNVPGVAETDHPPSESVFVRWCGSLYGPLEARIAASGGGAHRVSLSAPPGQDAMLRIPDSALEGLAGHLRIGGVAVSLDRSPPYRSGSAGTCTYELVLADAVSALRREAEEEVPVYRDDELIGRAAKRLLLRKERQQLSALLERLQDQLGDMPEDVDARELIESTRRSLETDDARGLEVAEALLGSGILDEHLERAIEERTRQHVESSAASLAAQIESRVAAQREELDRLVERREDEQSELEAREREAEARLSERIDASWREHRRELAEERDRLDRERLELETQAREAAERLASVSARFSEDRDRVLDDFLAILPLLQQAMPGVVRSAGTADIPINGQEVSPGRSGPAEPRAFTLPDYVSSPAARDEAQPTEAEFFERLASHVRDAGFTYRTLDLQAFHLNVKCGDFTLVTGGPGTGKSSLPRLYAEALSGREGQALDERSSGRYLNVPVRPAWVDLMDVIGHANALEHTFEPSDSGLFEVLICAAEERDRKGSDTGMYVVCFDDMDLAPVEQYLSGLLQVLPRPERQRLLRVFDAHAVRASDPFHRWHLLPLPRSLRFTGTARQDETGRAPGVRLLDGAGAVRLQPGRPRELLVHHDETPLEGTPVRWRTYARWVREAALPAEQASILDRVDRAFSTLGVPLTPRRYRDLCRFVASAGEICSAETAFDLQLAAHVYARPRRPWTRALEDAVEDAARILEAEGDRFPETLRALEPLLEAGAEGDDDV